MDTAKKLKIYSDTTIPNYLFADDTPDEKEATERLWEKCIAGEYEVCVSQVFLREINATPQPKLNYIGGVLRFLIQGRSDEYRRFLNVAAGFKQVIAKIVLDY